MPKLAVIGFPVAHSRSPAMQNAALEALGLAGEWSYGAVEATPGAFEMTVRELASLDYAGANVTVPHKEAALALADEATETARQIGAANTLSFAGKRIAADNTDAGGLLASISGSPERALHWGPYGDQMQGGAGRALVFGAGGAARAAIWALAHADSVSEGRLPRFRVDVWNRTRSRADVVYEELGGAAVLGGAVVGEPDPAAYGVIVNTTAVGLRGKDPFA